MSTRKSNMLYRAIPCFGDFSPLGPLNWNHGKQIGIPPVPESSMASVSSPPAGMYDTTRAPSRSIFATPKRFERTTTSDWFPAGAAAFLAPARTERR